MKPFIDFNTEKRKATVIDFEKYFFKLMINAVYGKSLETVQKRIDFCLVTNEHKMIVLIANPRFVHANVYKKHLVGVMMKQKTVYLNRPLYPG